jgi:hypothetical protein
MFVCLATLNESVLTYGMMFSEGKTNKTVAEAGSLLACLLGNRAKCLLSRISSMNLDVSAAAKANPRKQIRTF